MNQMQYQQATGHRSIDLQDRSAYAPAKPPLYGRGGHQGFYNNIQNYATGSAYESNLQARTEQDRREEYLANEKKREYLETQQRELQYEAEQAELWAQRQVVRKSAAPGSHQMRALLGGGGWDDRGQGMGPQRGYVPLQSSMVYQEFAPAHELQPQQQQDYGENPLPIASQRVPQDAFGFENAMMPPQLQPQAMHEEFQQAHYQPYPASYEGQDAVRDPHWAPTIEEDVQAIHSHPPREDFSAPQFGTREAPQMVLEQLDNGPTQFLPGNIPPTHRVLAEGQDIDRNQDSGCLPVDEEQIKAKNFHWTQHQAKQVAQDSIDAAPIHQSTKPAAIHVSPPRQPKCFARSHNYCSPKEDDEGPILQDNVGLVEKLAAFDKNIVKYKHKNNDHFHLVQAKQVYENLNQPFKENQALMTATVYSGDSHEMQQKKDNQYRYAQVLIEQMKIQKDSKLKHLAARKSVAVELDVREKLDMVRVPDIPRLPERKQDNFGFFDKFYGPDRHAQDLARKVENLRNQTAQVEQMASKDFTAIQNNSRARDQQEAQLVNAKLLEEQRQLNEHLIAQNCHYQEQIRKLTNFHSPARIMNPLEGLGDNRAFEMGAGPASGQGFPPESHQPLDFQSQVGYADKQLPQVGSGQMSAMPQPPAGQLYPSPRLTGAQARQFNGAGQSPPNAVGGGAAAGKSPHQLSHKRHLTPETIHQQIDKETYKEQLLRQVKEKKNRELREKQLRYQEDILEEERVRREVEELNRLYQEQGSEREQIQAEGHFEVAEYKDPLRMDGLVAEGPPGTHTVDEEQIKNMTRPLTKLERAAKQKKEAKLDVVRPMHVKMVVKSNQRQAKYDKYAFGQEPPKEKPVKIVKQISLTEALKKAREEEEAAISRPVQWVDPMDERPIKSTKLETMSNNQEERRMLPIAIADGAGPPFEPVVQLFASAVPPDQNLQLFKESMEEMKDNHAELVSQYNQEMAQLKEMKALKARDLPMDIAGELNQVQADMQHMMERLDSQQEQMGRQPHQLNLTQTRQMMRVNSEGSLRPLIRPLQPNSQLSQKNGEHERELESSSQLQRQEILVNFKPQDQELVLNMDYGLDLAHVMNIGQHQLEPPQSNRSQKAMLNRPSNQYQLPPLDPSQTLRSQHARDQQIPQEVGVPAQRKSQLSRSRSRRLSLPKLPKDLDLPNGSSALLISHRLFQQTPIDFDNIQQKPLNKNGSTFRMPPQVKSMSKYQSVADSEEEFTHLKRTTSQKNLPPIPGRKSSQGLLAKNEVIVSFQPEKAAITAVVEDEALVEGNPPKEQAILAAEDLQRHQENALEAQVILEGAAVIQEAEGWIEPEDSPFNLAEESLQIEDPPAEQQVLVVDQIPQENPENQGQTMARQSSQLKREVPAAEQLEAVKEIQPQRNDYNDQHLLQEIQQLEAREEEAPIAPQMVTTEEPDFLVQAQTEQELVTRAEAGMLQADIESPPAVVAIEPDTNQYNAASLPPILPLARQLTGSAQPSLVKTRLSFRESAGTKQQNFAEEVDFRYEAGQEKSHVEIMSSWHGAFLKPPSEKVAAKQIELPDQVLVQEDNEAKQDHLVHAQIGSPQRPTHEEVEENMRQMAEQVEEAVTFIQSLNPQELKATRPKAEKSLGETKLQNLEEAPESQAPNEQNVQVQEQQVQMQPKEVEADHTEQVIPENNIDLEPPAASELNPHETQIDPVIQQEEQAQLISEADQMHFAEYKQELQNELKWLEEQERRSKAIIKELEEAEAHNAQAEWNRRQKMEEVLGFVNEKKKNNEPITVKRTLKKVNTVIKAEEIVEAPTATGKVELPPGPKVMTSVDKKAEEAMVKQRIVNEVPEDQMLFQNEVDGVIFDQRGSLRQAIKQTNIETLGVNPNNYYAQLDPNLYADQLPSRQQLNSSTNNQPVRARPPKPANLEHLYRSGGMAAEASAADSYEAESANTGLFTIDSRVNDYPKVHSFYENKMQFQAIAYRGQKSYKFGCYGPVQEEDGLMGINNDMDNEIFAQKSVKYNKNDPFGVNMRLRQSLTNTNKILFRQDNQRYIENTDFIRPAQRKLLIPKTSIEKLAELKAKQVVNELIIDNSAVTVNLYRDESSQGCSQPAASEKNQPIKKKVTFEGVEFLDMKSTKEQLGLPEPNFDFNEELYKDIESVPNEHIMILEDENAMESDY